MNKRYKAIVSSVLTLSMLLSLTACTTESESLDTDETTTTTTEYVRTTLETDENVQSEVERLQDQVKDETVEVTKKIKWLAWYEIDETSAPYELFKQVYGVPEEGDTSYGDDADDIFSFQNVSYGNRYDTLATLIQSGDSPDLFPFEIQNFPYSVYKNMFQPIDGIVDTTTDEWSATRDVMDKFMWGGKNYCAVTTVNSFSLLWYQRSVVEEAGLDDPYDLYKAGEWTWDTFLAMCEGFSSPEEGKYCLDGWNPENSFIATTGIPLIEITDGQLVDNMNDVRIERVMDMLTTMCTQNYRYPRHELNGHGINLSAWANGDTLFFDDGTWALESATWQKYIKNNVFSADDVFFVPFPRDPNADDYYQMMKQDAFMLVAGAENVDGYKAVIAVNLACANDESVALASREKGKNDFGWTDEQYDLLDEIATLSPVFDFKNGIGEDIAGTSTAENDIESLTKTPYVYGTSSYTQLRAENEGRIRARLDLLNASLG